MTISSSFYKEKTTVLKPEVKYGRLSIIDVLKTAKNVS